ncbi:hypothetical protein BMS3Bbin05_00751 [bacterium BMS3Bbin05]|nr:hypothetical protein BMS3Bbin05_00751 [bacterium BMS3Bbin05]
MRPVEKRPGFHKPAAAISIVFSLVIAYLLVAPLFGRYYAGNLKGVTRSSLRKADAIDFGNYKYPYYLALDSLFSIVRYNPERAALLFRKGLGRYPLHQFSWYGLARAYYAMGMTDRGDMLFDAIYRSITYDSRLAWDSGIFLFTKGDKKRGAMFLGKYLALNPGDLGKVLDICYQLGLETDDILYSLLGNRPAAYDPLLNYLAGRKRLDDIEKVWNTVKHAAINNKTKLNICNASINGGRYGFARSIWNDLSVRKGNTMLIKNGNFEFSIMNGCYGWIKGKTAGMKTGTDEDINVSGMKSFSVGFDGAHNPGVSVLRQVVPLEAGGGYGLTAYIKTEDITTTNGLYFYISGFKCRMRPVRSEIFTGTVPWTRVGIGFDVPEGCSAVTVSLRRDRSRKFNNKIGGSAWIDNVEMEKTGPRTSDIGRRT